ncbi:hypothetical protein FRC14_007434 [Serendipita sp. 396]|nr:hypothetical protein FRC14_007434 [Serendipita sp. 396]KAG8777377.1 hypothetical protein FRC15_011379 [Serendipita sp. 397]KAG8864146.1 hypothetical protein FRC20_010371 [Serendipita sp. 405]KAG9052346.1 hypothetical protein FS842_010022 [Serendipita sp. 407]
MRSLISLLAPVAGTLFAATAVTAAPLQQRDASWTPVDGGCWTDNVNGQRVLTTGVGAADDMTPDKCQTLCDAQGFPLAGMEYGRECYCGYTLFGGNHASTDGICTMACAGDAAQTCGGPNAISIYVKDNFAYTNGPASPLASYNEFENPRCFRDYVGQRIFTAGPSTGIPADQMTVQKCIDGCAAAGFTAAGLEYARECYCGNTGSPLATGADISDCSMPCLGDASAFCGGAEHLLIYTKPNTTPEPTPEGDWTPAGGGCWTDSVQSRALSTFMGGYDDLTPAKCQVLCEQAGFSLAGVEWSRECYCGNTIMGGSQPSSGICNMACSGDSTQTCGDGGAINIYVKGDFQYTTGIASVLESYNDYEKTQCWQDSTANRILTQAPTPIISGDQMTVQKCIDGCAAAGYSWAGVEYGRECYCDNLSIPPTQSEDMNDCNMPCTGDATQYCGGPNRMLVYHKPSIITHTGVLEVRNKDTDELMGYITKSQYVGLAWYKAEKNLAAWFSFQARDDATSVTQIELTNQVPYGGYPLMGLIQSYRQSAEITMTNKNTVVVGAVTHTEPGATPQDGANGYAYIAAEKQESSVWTVDLTTGYVTPQWINPDGSTPPTIMFVNGAYLAATADLDAYNAAVHLQQPSVTLPGIKLKFNSQP